MNWSPPPGTAGLIFDCDGTLADTMPIHYRAWRTIFDPHGIVFTEERFYQLGGMPTLKIIQLISAETGTELGDPTTMTRDKEAAFLETLAEVEPIARVVEIARTHRGVLPIAVATGGYRAVIEKTLDFVGIRHWFEALVCAEDTPKHKPEPHVFWEAARRLGNLEPSRCVVFEDTDIGMEAARRAGMVGVDVRDWLPPRPGEFRRPAA